MYKQITVYESTYRNKGEGNEKEHQLTFDDVNFNSTFCICSYENKYHINNTYVHICYTKIFDSLNSEVNNSLQIFSLVGLFASRREAKGNKRLT